MHAFRRCCLLKSTDESVVVAYDQIYSEMVQQAAAGEVETRQHAGFQHKPGPSRVAQPEYLQRLGRPVKGVHIASNEVFHSATPRGDTDDPFDDDPDEALPDEVVPDEIIVPDEVIVDVEVNRSECCCDAVCEDGAASAGKGLLEAQLNDMDEHQALPADLRSHPTTAKEEREATHIVSPSPDSTCDESAIAEIGSPPIDSSHVESPRTVHVNDEVSDNLSDANGVDEGLWSKWPRPLHPHPGRPAFPQPIGSTPSLDSVTRSGQATSTRSLPKCSSGVLEYANILPSELQDIGTEGTTCNEPSEGGPLNGDSGATRPAVTMPVMPLLLNPREIGRA